MVPKVSSKTTSGKRKRSEKDSYGNGNSVRDLPKSNASQHNLIFAAWLVQKYGQGYLRDGGVIDVAGGLGLLSFELSVRYGVNSTVIDPRIVPLKGLLRRKMKNLHKNRSNGTQDQDRSALMTFLHRNGLKVKDDGILLESVSKSINDDTKEVLPFNSIQATFSIASEEEHVSALLRNSSLLVGMHSDQATESIVDEALRHKKPFAVVPCCVFPSMFPGRYITSDEDHEGKKQKPVISYDDFVQYLESKHDKIRKENLCFFGRNVVLYMTAEDCE